jgi:Flp pilus assembly protein TadG
MIRTCRRLFRPHLAGERGSAVVEFVFLETLLLVPLIYLVMTLARVQAGAFAVATAAREAGRAYVTADTVDAAPSRAEAASRIAFEDQGFSPREGGVTMTCDGSPCLRAGGRIEVEGSVRVALPLVPAFARRVVPLEITLRASHVAVVDRFREVR